MSDEIVDLENDGKPVTGRTMPWRAPTEEQIKFMCALDRYYAAQAADDEETAGDE
jgi:hypothetical protein